MRHISPPSSSNFRIRCANLRPPQRRCKRCRRHLVTDASTTVSSSGRRAPSPRRARGVCGRRRHLILGRSFLPSACVRSSQPPPVSGPRGSALLPSTRSEFAAAAGVSSSRHSPPPLDKLGVRGRRRHLVLKARSPPLGMRAEFAAAAGVSSSGLIPLPLDALGFHSRRRRLVLAA
ncbi:hypothetical protein C2845_PMPSC032378 [Panicum miliaceum]|uniref:Uncharacterized protein n=1 Tax=Panicum miliaceum TaxID=4540 RepID=A0A3L6P9Q9_PANMI|nr:hypothetical protein C2845_PMPSC032378 [Panicum miliaceum]